MCRFAATVLEPIFHRAVTLLPTEKDRLAKALAIVEADGVTAGARGCWTVRNGSGPYSVACSQHQWSCTCADHAYRGVCCKHIYASQLFARCQQLAEERDALDDCIDVTPTPEPPAAVHPTIPAQHLTFIQGKPFVRYAGLLELAHAKGLTSLSARFISVTDQLALAEATATFADGQTFSEAGDATPSNVTRKVAPHFARMALTRAKARCLRDALNIDLCSLEELGD